MGLFKGLFSKEGREKLKVIGQYENCQRLHKRLLAAAKAFTAADIKSVYDDAVFLFTDNPKEFLSASAKGETFMWGTWGDDLPDISKLPSETSVYKDGPRSKLSDGLVGVIEAFLTEYRFKDELRANYSSSAGRHVEKAPYNYWAYDLNELSRVTVKRNDATILQLSPLKYYPLNEVMSDLHAQIVNPRRYNEDNGISCLDIEVEIYHCCSEYRSFPVSLYYDDRKPSKTDQSREHLKPIYNQTAPLISAIGSFIRNKKYDLEFLQWLKER